MMALQPFLLGRGRAGAAIENALRILAAGEPEFNLLPPRWIPRGQSLSEIDKGGVAPVLFIANPHGLHAATILEAERAGFSFIGCEKPVCVSLQEAESLANVQATVAVFHGYRMMWGPQTLREMIARGELGDVFAIEGTYWQSSAAQRALSGEVKRTWKDEPALGGKYDTLIDIGSHWVDLAAHLKQAAPTEGRGWLSYANAPSPHRDTHVQLQFKLGGTRAMVSASKNFHGGTNRFEINVLGTKAAASWNFLSPDELVVGEGADRRIVTRPTSTLGAKLPPFHGMGWTEGYVEICRRLLRAAAGQELTPFPSLRESLSVMKFLLGIVSDRP